MSIDDLVARERTLFTRLSATEAFAAMQDGALLVDTRPESQRREHGEIPGAVIVDRNVLEWRLDPASAHRLPCASYDRLMIVLCQQGYSSSLVAATLLRLGLNATDVIDGVEGWLAAGLPISRSVRRAAS